MKRILLAVAAAILATSALADTYTFSSSGTSARGQPVSLTGTVTLPDPAASTTTGSGTGSTPPPSSTTSWVYHNGVMNWQGDWSWAMASVDYKDSSGAPLSGSYDIKLQLAGQWGGWLPYYNGNCTASGANCFSVAPYNYLLISIKPTVLAQKFNIFFEAAGDTNEGQAITPAALGYCGTEIAGQWMNCKIPLSAFNTAISPVVGTEILKFGVQDDSGTANAFYVDDVGFE